MKTQKTTKRPKVVFCVFTHCGAQWHRFSTFPRKCRKPRVRVNLPLKSQFIASLFMPFWAHPDQSCWFFQPGLDSVGPMTQSSCIAKRCVGRTSLLRIIGLFSCLFLRVRSLSSIKAFFVKDDISGLSSTGVVT